MESASQTGKRFEYRDFVYKVSPRGSSGIYVEVVMASSVRSLGWHVFSTYGSQRGAERAVRKAHRWARNRIDKQMVLLNAIDKVDSNGCRGLPAHE